MLQSKKQISILFFLLMLILYFLFLTIDSSHYTKAHPTYTTGIYPEGHPLAGYKYYEFNFTGDVQEYISPADVETEIEVWGASTNTPYPSGRGGYARGRYFAKKGEVLYVYVGGMGEEGATGSHSTGWEPAYVRLGGWNGGGNSLGRHPGGSGASDVRTVPGNWDDLESLQSRIIVAGGSAGLAHGGGLEGENGSSTPEFGWYAATGGTQTEGGKGGYELSKDTNFEKAGIGADGQLGKGGDARGTGSGGGGGGGYYGGGGGTAGGFYKNSSGTHGGSGSSYIGGVMFGETIPGANEPMQHGKVRITPLIPPNNPPEIILNEVKQ